ncbi:MAG TPA: FecR domain-containing protein, partial [Kofleriaceae bacterium]
GSDDGQHHAAAPRSPSRIATADAPSAVSVADVSLEIAPQSALLVDEDRDRGVLFILERGEVTFRVAPVGDQPPVVVQAGDVRIEVVGTAFAVSREGDSARVVVYEGVVSLVQRGERARLAAGSVWPGSAAPPLDAPSPLVAPPPPAERSRRLKQPPAAPQPGAPLAAPPLSDKERYRRAQELERSDPHGARALYRELVARGGAWAPMALYAHALLEDRLGERAAARQLLERYLSRYPEGLNAADARELLDDSGSR